MNEETLDSVASLLFLALIALALLLFVADLDAGRTEVGSYNDEG